MRISTITFALFLALTGCKSDDKQEDPCERASDNASRLVRDDDAARATYGEEPLSLGRCRAASLTAETVQCIGYASSWPELRACDPELIVPRNDIGAR